MRLLGLMQKYKGLKNECNFLLNNYLFNKKQFQPHLITIGCVSAVTRGKLFRRNQLKAQGAVNKIFNFSKCLSTGGFKLIKSGFSHFQCT
jgi:hypothetical protein